MQVQKDRALLSDLCHSVESKKTVILCVLCVYEQDKAAERE